MLAQYDGYFENAFVERTPEPETAGAAVKSAKAKAERKEEWERWQSAIMTVLFQYPEAHEAVRLQVEKLRAKAGHKPPL
jgi:hypothetical protein